MLRRSIASLAATVFLSGAWTDASAQRPRAAPPPGNRITALDGDMILVENDARIRVIRRRDANVRVVFDRLEQWIMLLADYAGPNGPDGQVDATHTYTSVRGDWPLEERWEGQATIEEYFIAGDHGFGEIGFATSRGLVQMLNERNSNMFRDPAAIAVMGFGGAGRSTGNGDTMDQAEPREVAQLRQNIQRQGSNSASARSGVGISMGLTAVGPGSEVSSTNTVSGTFPAPTAPVRVGAALKPPVKLIDVPPVMPPEAIRANIRGVVILEAVIDTDGTVKSTRVLRSIPMLDQAAVEAVRQWRYQPVLLNGQPVPVIMTVTVPFQ